MTVHVKEVRFYVQQERSNDLLIIVTDLSFGISILSCRRLKGKKTMQMQYCVQW